MAEPVSIKKLDPRLGLSLVSHAQELSFVCPLCRKARIIINIWRAPAATVAVDKGIRHSWDPTSINIWHAEQNAVGDWNSLTITPSIDSKHNGDDPTKCPGWHGFVTKGMCI